MESQIKAVEQKVVSLFEENPECFLVEVKIIPGNHIKVFVDADHGITLEKLIPYNRRLYKMIEESGIFPDDDFSLEVSSPGLDEPLKLYRQYIKNIGRDVEVIQKDGIKKEGKLVKADQNEIVLEEEKGRILNGKPKGFKGQAGKKKEVMQHTIAFDQIKSTKIQILF